MRYSKTNTTWFILRSSENSCSLGVGCVKLLPSALHREVVSRIQHLGTSNFYYFPQYKVVLEPWVSPEHTSKYVDTVTVLQKTWTKGHWSLDDLWPHICWGLMCDSTQGSLCPSPMKIHQSMWIQWPFLQKTWSKGHWPLDDLWPHICWGHLCDSTQGSLCPSPMKIHQSMWVQWPFLQKLEPKVIDPKMTFDPTSVEVTCVTLPKDHCVQVPWKYIKVCGYSEPFAKTWTKGHWPLDDLWPHICWGHMCDSTQGTLCPSPMGIHQCMWIQWSILQITTYIHILHTYYIHTKYRISDHIVSFWTTFRRDNNDTMLYLYNTSFKWQENI